LQSDATVAIQRAEQALSAAHADKEALQKEIDHIKQDLISRSATAEAEQQNIACMQQELELIKAAEVTESKCADAAETLADKHRQETELLREADLEAFRLVQEQLNANVGLKDALQDKLPT
jgi:hypothetical protein